MEPLDLPGIRVYEHVKPWLSPLEDAAHIFNAPPEHSSDSIRIQMQWLRKEMQTAHPFGTIDPIKKSPVL